MIGKITSEMISRRWALSLLGALGFGAAPTSSSGRLYRRRRRRQGCAGGAP